MPDPASAAAQFAASIRERGLTIYEPVEMGDPDLWLPTQILESLLNKGLVGVSLAGMPLRTRSKAVKELICRALGYPVPRSFRRTQPQFPGQSFDVYVQKSDNVQVWNQEISVGRRYVLVRVDQQDSIARVKVVTGDTLRALDTTGTLTQKYQARVTVGNVPAELVARHDTELLRPLVSSSLQLSDVSSPSAQPEANQLLSIRDVFDRLTPLVGVTFTDSGHDQERNRGAELHRLVCRFLGYDSYHDDGRFPDVRHQLLEVKLQTSPTIDLGLVSPDSTEPLDVPRLDGRQVRHCDVRYALFYAAMDAGQVTLTHVFVSTGERFFTRFRQFQGNVRNRKLQIPLPRDFFEG